MIIHDGMGSTLPPGSRVSSLLTFCGKYRVPLMQFLCSAMCVSDDTNYSSSSEDEADEAAKYRMKKVLLG